MVGARNDLVDGGACAGVVRGSSLGARGELGQTCWSGGGAEAHAFGDDTPLQGEVVRDRKELGVVAKTFPILGIVSGERGGCVVSPKDRGPCCCTRIESADLRSARMNRRRALGRNRFHRGRADVAASGIISAGGVIAVDLTCIFSDGARAAAHPSESDWTEEPEPR